MYFFNVIEISNKLFFDIVNQLKSNNKVCVYSIVMFTIVYYILADVYYKFFIFKCVEESILLTINSKTINTSFIVPTLYINFHHYPNNNILSFV